MKCMNCNAEIAEGLSQCPVCGEIYNKVERYQMGQNEETISGIHVMAGRINKLKNNIITGFILLIAIVCLCVGLFCMFDEKNKSRNYVETTGVLVGFKPDEEGYTGIYQYTVDGINYTVSPKRISSESNFDKTEIVKYNPQKPSEAIVSAKWEWLVIGSIVSIVILVIIACSKREKSTLYVNDKKIL